MASDDRFLIELDGGWHSWAARIDGPRRPKRSHDPGARFSEAPFRPLGDDAHGIKHIAAGLNLGSATPQHGETLVDAHRWARRRRSRGLRTIGGAAYENGRWAYERR